MKSYEFNIKGVLVINAETPDEAEAYLRESLNPGGEMFNIQAEGKEIPVGHLDTIKVYEEYAVNIKC